MAAERSDVSYFPFDLDDEESHHPGLIRSLLANLTPRFASGEIEPVAHRAFPLERIGDAVRYLTLPSRVGKGVVAIAPDVVRTSCPPTGEIHADATYLVTGGLGGLGLHVARYLVERGARCLVLCGRGGPATAEQFEALDRLRAMGGARGGDPSRPLPAGRRAASARDDPTRDAAVARRDSRGGRA